MKAIALFAFTLILSVCAFVNFVPLFKIYKKGLLEAQHEYEMNEKNTVSFEKRICVLWITAIIYTIASVLCSYCFVISLVQPET